MNPPGGRRKGDALQMSSMRSKAKAVQDVQELMWHMRQSRLHGWLKCLSRRLCADRHYAELPGVE
jgi:hypothetical protein